VSEKKTIDWSKRVARRVDYEDTMDPERVARVWREIYTEAGAQSEDQQEAVRCAVYEYGAKNGTVKIGNYTGTIVTEYGRRFSSKIIATACKGTIRQFFRGNMDESYDALNEGRVLENDPRMTARAVNSNVPLAAIMSLCDWFKDCPKMSTLEVQHHNRLFVNKNAAATAGRGGSLEDVQNRLVAETEMGGAAISSPSGVPIM
jgi:hypothetical protein